MTPVTSKMGRMSAPDIHEERLETLRKQAVERLRARRAYRCPAAAIGASKWTVPRCGEVCESPWRRDVYELQGNLCRIPRVPGRFERGMLS